jgi:hypothetical protein
MLTLFHQHNFRHLFSISIFQFLCCPIFASLLLFQLCGGKSFLIFMNFNVPICKIEYLLHKAIVSKWVMCVQPSAFAEKQWLLTWAYEWTKNRRKGWHLCLHFVPVVLCSEPLSPAATLESRKDRITSFWQGMETTLREQESLAGQITPPNEGNYL